jgi:hypothetical protein
MKNDYFLYLMIFIFIFVLWVYSGGPSRPISFAGPYLRPTYGPDGVETEAYGSTETFWGDWFEEDYTPDQGALPDASISPFRGSVFISGGDPEVGSARDEYLEIAADADVTLTGWQLVVAGSGAQVWIPEGTKGDSRSKRAVRLESGERLVITTGSRPDRDDYTDYFESTWYVYLGRNRDLFPNGGDTITLLDGSGKVVDQYSY